MFWGNWKDTKSWSRAGVGLFPSDLYLYSEQIVKISHKKRIKLICTFWKVLAAIKSPGQKKPLNDEALKREQQNTKCQK